MVKLTHGFFTITLQIYDYYFFTTSIFYCKISSIFKKLIKEISIMANVFENTWNKLKELTRPKSRGFRVEAGLGAVGAIALATLAVVFPPIAWPLIITLAGIVAVVAVSAAVVAIGAFISSFFKKEDKKEEQDASTTLAIEDSPEADKKLDNQEKNQETKDVAVEIASQTETKPASSTNQIYLKLKLNIVDNKVSAEVEQDQKQETNNENNNENKLSSSDNKTHIKAGNDYDEEELSDSSPTMKKA
jgi:hypothetical protein